MKNKKSLVDPTRSIQISLHYIQININLIKREILVSLKMPKI